MGHEDTREGRIMVITTVGFIPGVDDLDDRLDDYTEGTTGPDGAGPDASTDPDAIIILDD
jgi:hypothetical protein